MKKIAALSFFIFLFNLIGYSQATLPLSRTTWNGGAPAGWTDNGTGSYTSSFACSGNNGGRLDGTGDYYQVFFSSAPDQLSFDLKGASFSGGTFDVEESADGSTWSTLSTFTSIVGSCNSHTYTLDCATRYVRFFYTNKSSGNVSVDDVSISSGTPCPACSGCSVDDAGLSSVACNNNGTTPDDTDDYITFELNPTGCDLGATYSVSVSGGGASSVTPNSGISYGAPTTFTVNTGSAGGGDVTITITDVSGGGCTLDVVASDPGTCSAVASSSGGGVIVNEYSNGDSGTKEYYELLVIGDPCATVDIREWIFDDNNGPDDATCEGFTDNTATNSGIAGGHNRFKNITRWSAVPVGSIILIYNDGDKNQAIIDSGLADDPTDSNNDLVYVLPISDSGLEGTGTVPVQGGSCGYSGGTYAAASWNYIGLRNSGDACQTRRPDGSYFHGFAYGSNLTGGPDNLYFSGSGTDKNYYLNCGHHSFITDYSDGDGDISDGSSDETPGAVNNSLNQEIIDYYRGTSGCGTADACVTILSAENIILKGKTKGETNRLFWRIDELHNIAKYDILKSKDNISFESLVTIRNNYSPSQKIIDKSPFAKTYYRIRTTTTDGSVYFSNTLTLENKSNTSSFKIESIYPNPAQDNFSFDFKLNKRGAKVSLSVYNIVGELVDYKELESSQTVMMNSHGYSNGLYTIVLSNQEEKQAYKLIIQR